MFKLNLQLFAASTDNSNGTYSNYFNAVPVDTTGMATTANVGTSYKDSSGNPITGELARLSTQMKMVYSQFLITDAEANLVHAQFLESEALPANHGDTVEWRKWEDFEKALTPLVEGVTPAPQRISSNHVHARVRQYGAWSVLTDLVQLETIDKTLTEFVEKHSSNAKKTLDTITREKMISGCTNKVYAGNADSIPEMSAVMTPKDVARVAIYLENNNAPTFDGDYVCIIHPTVKFDIITNDKEWIDVVKYSSVTQIFKGEIGKLYGVRFVRSTEAKIVKAANVGKGTAAAPAVKIAAINLESTTPVGIKLPSNTLDTSVTGEIKAGDKLWIQDVSADTLTVEEVEVASVSGQDITLTAMPTSFTAAQNDIVYMPESAAGGKDYFVCLFLGRGAGRRVALGQENAEIIVKPIGSAGSTDPLNQRGSCGWKVNGYTAAITNPAYIFAYYCTSAITGVKAN